MQCKRDNEIGETERNTRNTMSATSQTPKRRPSTSKKLKQDKENIQRPGEDQDQTMTKTPNNAQSSKSLDNEELDDHPQNKTNGLMEEEGEEPDVQDETTTQSFAERLKILNLQSDVSDRLTEPNDSEPGSNDGPREEELGLSRKMIKRQKQAAARGSTNHSTSLNGTQPHPSMMPIASIGSFAQTLTQALRSTDTKLLETCFLQYESKKNKYLIVNTIQRLPKSLLHNLIQQLVLCLNRKKRGHGDGITVAPVKRTKALIEWVRQILIIHMSYLLTIPSLVTHLKALHASLQKRLNLHTKLLALSGRLDLVLNQIELKKVTKERNEQMATNTRMMNETKGQKSASVSKKEPFKYVEGQSSESEGGEKEEEEKMSVSGDGEDSDNITSDSNDEDEEEEANGSDEGSVEEVVLGGSGSSEDNSEESDDDEQDNDNGEQLSNRFDDLLDLEAEESRSDSADHDDDDEDSEEDEEDEDEDDSMDGFINDETTESHPSDSD